MTVQQTITSVQLVLNQCKLHQVVVKNDGLLQASKQTSYECYSFVTCCWEKAFC